jgi:hypothetical protein
MRISSATVTLLFAVGLGDGCGSSSATHDGGGGEGGVDAAGGAGGAAGTDGGAGGAIGTGGAGGTAATGGAGGHDGTGGAGDGGSDGGSAGADGGGMSCSPACGPTSICVGTGTEGGAIIIANDAGVCPAGSHATGPGSFCTRDLSYACQPIPAGCGGTVTCACASSLCPTLHMCRGPSDGVLTCVEQVP